MFEPSRSQDEAAETMAEKYGRCRVEGRPDGSCLIVGLTDDVEMEYRVVSPDGTSVPAEHARRADQIARQPVAAPRGFLVIRSPKVEGGSRRVVPCADVEAVGRLMLEELRGAAKATVRARTSLTQDRELTALEQRAVIEATVAAALAEEVTA